MNSLKDFPVDYTRDLRLGLSLSDEELQDICSSIRDRVSNMVSMSPAISIIFPAYNEEMYLPLMLWTLSKLNTLLPIEIIGVNNNSSDRTGEIIQQSWLVRVDEVIKWVSYARQAWLEAARWEFIATTDSDTHVPSTWIDANMKYFFSQPNLVCISWWSIQEWAHFIHPIAKKLFRTIRNTIANQDTTLDMFYGHNSFYYKDIAMRVGWYEKWTDQWEDSLIARKMRMHGEILRIYSDPDIVVTTSARRIGTLLRVLQMWIERAYLIRQAHDLPWKTFSDVR